MNYANFILHRISIPILQVDVTSHFHNTVFNNLYPYENTMHY